MSGSDRVINWQHYKVDLCEIVLVNMLITILIIII